jgi:hypothetical protein
MNIIKVFFVSHITGNADHAFGIFFEWRQILSILSIRHCFEIRYDVIDIYEMFLHVFRRRNAWKIMFLWVIFQRFKVEVKLYCDVLFATINNVSSNLIKKK